ncbi:tankyrase-2 isoform X1 [Sorghum bicolor]|uniref:tankyrase-2 isoform X1 n=1 Tax=Sorghum bicolor TaxID=4558 RepID=UPI000B42603C|nr:tankyrase-2 isoform X1 [Sorghum bicolor]|eukprot:XP_021315477.1 tankyrase-2 isoform X1 [Sorghum bicolor]
MATPPRFPPALAGCFPRRGSPRGPDNPNPRPSSPLPGSPEDALLRAAFDGDLRLVKKMTRVLDGGEERGAEKVRAVRSSNGLGALHLAAARGKLPVCRYLVDDLGLDVNSINEAGLTPLTCAIDAGSVDVVQYLLNNGADTETLISTGLTPLVYAVGKGNCEIVQALLCKGAYVDALTTVGAALHLAAQNGRDDIVKVLLDHHADGFLIFLISQQHNKIAWGVNRPLIYAISARSLKCVKLLIEAGADVQGIGTETPLALAATDGLTDILKCLVQAGADPNVCDGFGFTPIETAARYNRREDVEILFPVTSRIPTVNDWSVDGIISYAKSKPALKDEDLYTVMLANLKFQGREAVKNKDYLGAVDIYTKAMNLDPADATLFANRSLCRLRMGDGRKALTDAVACKSMRPGWSKACYREGAARMVLKDYEKACGAFLDGLKLEPGNAEIESALWEALESLKISHKKEKE